MAYSPTLGRWLQPDPSGYTDGLNLQEFVGSSPVDYTDPVGLALVPTGGGKESAYASNPIKLSDFPQQVTDEFMNNHRWGGTNIIGGGDGRPARRIPTNDKNGGTVTAPSYREKSSVVFPLGVPSLCSRYMAVITYETNNRYAATYRPIIIDDPSLFGALRVLGEALVSAFNTMAEAHENMHIANYKSVYDKDIVAVGYGNTADAALAAARKNYQAQLAERDETFAALKQAVDMNGDRGRGKALLTEIGGLMKAKVF